MNQIRKRIVLNIQQWVGCSLEHDGQSLQNFVSDYLGDPRDLLSPKVSDCGLFALAIWSAVGVKDSRLVDGYEIGAAIRWVVEIAHNHGAIRYPKRDGMPGPGDLMHYYAPRPSSNDHVEFCLSEVDAVSHFAQHAGGGRQNCGIGEGESDILWNGGKPLQCWYDAQALVESHE
jgi:hypothetical protein